MKRLVHQAGSSLVKRLVCIGPALLCMLTAAPARAQTIAPARAQTIAPARAQTIAPARSQAIARAGSSVRAGGDEQEIRARRESSNQAIAKHDTAGIAAIFANDVVVVSSNSSKASGRALNAARFAEQFKARPDVVYRRTPDAITLFLPWGMASERGQWTGSWTDTDGKIAIGGSYFAKWRVINGTWFVESETYVPDRCTGGKYCTTVP